MRSKVHYSAHGYLRRIGRSQIQLLRDALNIFGTTFEIYVLAGEWLQRLKLRFGGKITVRAIVHGLAADEKLWLTLGVVYLEDFRELLEREAHRYAQLDMARATCLRLVMRHLVPLPTSEARR